MINRLTNDAAASNHIKDNLSQGFNSSFRKAKRKI